MRGVKMSYTIDEIKDDLISYDTKQFYMKHLVRSDNWYFENVLSIPQNKIITAVDDFKIIVSEAMGISYNSIMMVGSGKTGYSLSPKKCLKKFTVEPIDENKSDIDIAIISLPIFDRLWRDFRKAYDITNKRYYSFISREIYRGYINDRNINLIEPCRLFWKDISIEATKKLKQKMYFKHEISYRVYRSWEDFEEYNLESLTLLKEEVKQNAE